MKEVGSLSDWISVTLKKKKKKWSCLSEFFEKSVLNSFLSDWFLLWSKQNDLHMVCCLGENTNWLFNTGRADTKFYLIVTCVALSLHLTWDKKLVSVGEHHSLASSDNVFELFPTGLGALSVLVAISPLALHYYCCYCCSCISVFKSKYDH